LLWEAGYLSKAADVQRTGRVAPDDRALVNALLMGAGFAHATDHFPVAEEDDAA
jgi:hypothetical protein